MAKPGPKGPRKHYSDILTCSICSIEKHITEFSVNRIRRDGSIQPRTYCKKCHSEKRKEYREKNRIAIREKRKNISKREKEKIKIKRKEKRQLERITLADAYIIRLLSRHNKPNKINKDMIEIKRIEVRNYRERQKGSMPIYPKNIEKQNAQQAWKFWINEKATDDWLSDYYNALGKPWLNPRLSDAEQYRLRYRLDRKFQECEKIRAQKAKAKIPLWRARERLGIKRQDQDEFLPLIECNQLSLKIKQHLKEARK